MFREVSFVEVREVLRHWLRGERTREAGRLSGLDRKTAGALHPGRTGAASSECLVRQPIRSSPSAANWSVEIASMVWSTSTTGLPDRGDSARCNWTGSFRRCRLPGWRAASHSGGPCRHTGPSHRTDVGNGSDHRRQSTSTRFSRAQVVTQPLSVPAPLIGPPAQLAASLAEVSRHAGTSVRVVSWRAIGGGTLRALAASVSS